MSIVVKSREKNAEGLCALQQFFFGRPKLGIYQHFFQIPFADVHFLAEGTLVQHRLIEQSFPYLDDFLREPAVIPAVFHNALCNIHLLLEPGGACDGAYDPVMFLWIFHCKAAEVHLPITGRPIFDLIFFKLEFFELNGDLIVFFAVIQKSVPFNR